ncbi:MAG: transcription elongation factor GreA [Thermoleophilaceae bacterium]|nr:transcription elongation factor GreA [Thermoleophilaceae bacterium]
MTDPENLISKDTYDRLVTEVEDLEGRGRSDIAAQIKTAREWGDLKENAEYHAAKDAQGMLERKIHLLRERIDTAEIAAEGKADGRVGFGSVVKVRDESSGKEQEYELVSSPDQDLSNGKLSFESPVAQALSGRGEGDTAEVRLPNGTTRRFEVLSIA